jgi:hypothetical protein
MNAPRRIGAKVWCSVPGTALAALLLLGISLSAAATLRTIEQAYELTRNQVQLPDKPEGNLTVRPCPTCKPVILRVTTETVWFIYPRTGKPAGQPEVLAAFKASATNPRTLVYVYYEPQTRHVKRIVLDAPASVAQR